MRNRVIPLLAVALLILSIVAIAILVSKNTQEQGKIEVRYAVTSTSIANNKAQVKVLAGVFSGQDVDPFQSVRILDQDNLPYYPLNGFAKPSLDKGDSMEIVFEFFYPTTIQNRLEITNSSGMATYVDITFPERFNQQIVDIIVK